MATIVHAVRGLQSEQTSIAYWPDTFYNLSSEALGLQQKT